MKCRYLASLTAILLASTVSLASAQTITLPQVTSVGPADLFQDIVNGVPTAQNKYATAAQINGVLGYVISVPSSGFSLTFGNSQTYYLILPAGTLATGTFTMAPNPGDGQKACVRSHQTQSAVTIAANTGQTIGGTAVTAMTADTTYCWLYQASSTTWYPI